MIKKYQNSSKKEKVAVFLAIAVVVIFIVIPMFSLTDSFKNINQDTFNIDPNQEELVIRDLEIGAGLVAETGDQLTVHYRGLLEDGTIFDSSLERSPLKFTLGVGAVILGWDEGLLGMREGGSRLLIIPPSYAYGERQIGSIPPNSLLIFEVNLLEVLKSEL